MTSASEVRSGDVPHRRPHPRRARAAPGDGACGSGCPAVAPQIASEWHLDEATTAWLTLAVQLGFVAGTLLSATLNLPDVIRARHLFALCALLGAIDERAARVAACTSVATRDRAALSHRRFSRRRLSAGDEDHRHLVQDRPRLRARRAHRRADARQGLAVSRERDRLAELARQRRRRLDARGASARSLVLRFVARRAVRAAESAVRSLADHARLRATAACGSRTSATSDTCGSCTRCGRGRR